MYTGASIPERISYVFCISSRVVSSSVISPPRTTNSGILALMRLQSSFSVSVVWALPPWISDRKTKVWVWVSPSACQLWVLSSTFQVLVMP